MSPRLDPQALTEHVDRLYRAAWGLCGSPHDAEDLVQETFARVLARPRMLHGQDELAYLMRALRNTFLTQRRSASRRPVASMATLEDVEPVDPRSSGRPEEAFKAREALNAIAELPENYRMALVAVDVLGLSYREAASALDTREATIATRVFRAREQAALRLSDAPASDAPADTSASDRPADAIDTPVPASETPLGLGAPVSALEHPQPASPDEKRGSLSSREDPGPHGSLV